MSFYGKKFQKIQDVNTAELFEKVGITNEIVRMIHNRFSVTVFEKNQDGSIQYISLHDGNPVVNTKMFSGEEIDLVTDTGLVLKVVSNIEEKALKTIVKLPNGKEIHVDRYFTDNYMRMEVHVPGVDIIGVIDYKVIP